MYESNDEMLSAQPDTADEWDLPEPLECWTLDDFADLLPR